MGSKTVGSALLIAGCCIGAGMLGLPVVSGPYGFIPTLLMFLFGYAYMVVSGSVLSRLLVEEKERGGGRDVHLLSLSASILGRRGRVVTWILFGFLFYAVLTAYTIGSAKLLQEIVQRLFPAFPISMKVYALFSSVVVAFVIVKGTRAVDYVNRACLLGLISVYLAILVMASTEMEYGRLGRSDWNFSLFTTLPIIAFSFGYQNLLPSIASYLHFNIRAIRGAIILGATISLIIYILWEAIIFGIVPLETSHDWIQFIRSGDMITEVLSESMGASQFTNMMELFALFAIITSYITVGTSMSHFLEDGLLLQGQKEHKKRGLSVLLALAPPLVIGISYPALFLVALGYSGGVIAMLLFGILPALCRIARPSKYNSMRDKILERGVILFLLFGGIFIMALEIGARGVT